MLVQTMMQVTSDGGVRDNHIIKNNITIIISHI
jgi:hypothetical protein